MHANCSQEEYSNKEKLIENQEKNTIFSTKKDIIRHLNEILKTKCNFLFNETKKNFHKFRI